MKINTTSITVNATHEKEKAQFRLEFVIKDSDLQRAQISIYDRNDDPDAESEFTYLGAVYSEGGMLSCNLPNNCDLPFYFTGVQECLSKIDDHINNM